MKQIFYLIILLVIVNINVSAQTDSIYFKVKLLENKTYDFEINNVTEVISNTIQEDNNEKTDLDVLANNIKNSSMIHYTLQTGTEINSEIDFIIEYKQLKTYRIIGSKIDSTDGYLDSCKIYGKIKGQKITQIDSITMPNKNNTFIDILKNTMLNFEIGVVYPEKYIKVADQFMIESPMKLPLGFFNLDANVISRYKLNKIENGLAYFDVKQDIVGKTENFNDMKFSGSGKGEMIFNSNIFNTTYSNINSNMKMSMAFSGKKIEMTMLINSIIKIKLLD